jgi:hypothetical protein
MKVWEKHQNNKFGYGIEAFPKKKCYCFILHQNSMFYNDPFSSSSQNIFIKEKIILCSIQIQMVTKTM